jgi:hypothetical protein
MVEKRRGHDENVVPGTCGFTKHYGLLIKGRGRSQAKTDGCAECMYQCPRPVELLTAAASSSCFLRLIL